MLRDNIVFIACVLVIFTVTVSISVGIFIARETNWNIFKWEQPDTSTHLNNVQNSTTELPKKCEPPPRMDNFKKCGDRIADMKCCEYIWNMNYKREMMAYQICTSGNRDYKIIGGKTSSPGDFPHMAAVGWEIKADHNARKLRKKKQYAFLCGGSLISNKFVLTAAHCTYNDFKTLQSPQPVVVKLGTERIDNEDNKRNNIGNVLIKNIHIHPSYKPPKVYFDIALLELYRNISFTEYIQPACLYTSFNFTQTPSAELTITGWGVTDTRTNVMSNSLQVAIVKLIDYKSCHAKMWPLYNRNWHLKDDYLLCAGDDTRGVDACQGDSGGPLQARLSTTSGAMHTIIAITTIGQGCGLKSTAGIYTRVYPVLSWIEKIVWPENTLKKIT